MQGNTNVIDIHVINININININILLTHSSQQGMRQYLAPN